MDEIARATIEQAKGSEMIRDAMEQVLEMVTQIAMATREQGLGGELIMSAVEKMKELTAQVSSSTREQSKVGNFIASSTENITGMIQQIKRACDEQGRGERTDRHCGRGYQTVHRHKPRSNECHEQCGDEPFQQIEIMQKEMAVLENRLVMKFSGVKTSMSRIAEKFAEVEKKSGKVPDNLYYRR